LSVTNCLSKMVLLIPPFLMATASEVAEAFIASVF
jgi:hypothetical protein